VPPLLTVRDLRSHATRREILARLAESGDMAGSELARDLGTVKQNTVSAHLRRMRREGLLELADYQYHRGMVYRIRPEHLAEQRDLAEGWRRLTAPAAWDDDAAS
jgi:DNA-binding transcriptional ArsR family regulator